MKTLGSPAAPSLCRVVPQVHFNGKDDEEGEWRRMVELVEKNTNHQPENREKSESFGSATNFIAVRLLHVVT